MARFWVWLLVSALWQLNDVAAYDDDFANNLFTDLTPWVIIASQDPIDMLRLMHA